MSRAAPIINAKYQKNRSKTGRPSGAKAKQAMAYYEYGSSNDNPERQSRGQWVNSRGEAELYGNVVDWAVSAAKEKTYTYQLMLSSRDVKIEPQAFVKAMNAGAEKTGEFSDFHLIVHDDTNHTHAHVVGFRSKVMSKKELATWKEAVSESLTESETILMERDSKMQIGKSVLSAGQAEPDNLEIDFSDAFDWEQGFAFDARAYLEEMGGLGEEERVGLDSGLEI